jgi:hypothetical protein
MSLLHLCSTLTKLNFSGPFLRGNRQLRPEAADEAGSELALPKDRNV